MTGKISIAALLAAAWIGIAGCAQPKTTTTTKDPFDGAVAQQEKPAAQDTENLGEAVKVSGKSLVGKIYFPTGEPAGSSLLIEKAVPAEVQANKPFDYDIKVTNVAKLKLEGVEVEETVPGTLKIKDVTEGTPDGKPNTFAYKIGTLNPGESKLLHLSATATQAGPLGMCLSARYSTSLCMATSVVAPAIKLTSTGPAEALKCDPLSYKLTVANTGSGQARNIKIETVLPDGLTSQDGKNSLTFDAGTLKAGETKDFAFTAKASKIGSYTIKANVKADEGLASEAAPVTTAVKEPVLTIAITGPEKMYIGQLIPYEITVINKGNAVAKNVTIFNSLFKNTAVQVIGEGGKADSTGKVRWNIGDLAPGASKKVSIVITYPEAGDLKSPASVVADCAETVAAMASTTISGVPALLMEVVDDPDPVKVGDQTTYLIEITNQGTAPGTNIKLACNLEDPMTLVSASGETKEKIDGKALNFGPIGLLAPKAKATYKVTVKANKTGDVRFKASITSDQLGRPVEETEATTFYGQ